MRTQILKKSLSHKVSQDFKNLADLFWTSLNPLKGCEMFTSDVSYVFQLLCDDVTGLKFNPVLYPRVSISEFLTPSVTYLLQASGGNKGWALLRFTLVPKSSELICSCAPGESQNYLLYTLWHAWTTYCVWEKPWPSQGCAWSVRHGKHKRLNYGKALTHIFTPVGAFSHFLFSLAQGFTTDRQFWWARSEQHF